MLFVKGTHQKLGNKTDVHHKCVLFTGHWQPVNIANKRKQLDPECVSFCSLRSLNKFSQIRLQLLNAAVRFKVDPLGKIWQVSRNHSAWIRLRNLRRNRRKGLFAQVLDAPCLSTVAWASQSLLTFKLCKLLFSSGKCHNLRKISLPSGISRPLWRVPVTPVSPVSPLDPLDPCAPWIPCPPWAEPSLPPPPKRVQPYEWRYSNSRNDPNRYRSLREHVVDQT